MIVNIKGLNKAAVLKTLYDHSKQQGMGLLHPRLELSLEDCQKLLDERQYFDYLNGVVLKLEFPKVDDQFGN